MLRCLSLTQPWAQLVVSGFKKIETRDWASKIVDCPLGIHAAKSFPSAMRAMCVMDPRFRETLAKIGITYPGQLPLGAMLGVVHLKACVPIDRSFSSELPELDSLERAFGDYSPGRVMWLLEDIQAFEQPIPIERGFPGLWNWDLPSPELLRTRGVA